MPSFEQITVNAYNKRGLQKDLLACYGRPITIDFSEPQTVVVGRLQKNSMVNRETLIERLLEDDETDPYWLPTIMQDMVNQGFLPEGIYQVNLE